MRANALLRLPVLRNLGLMLRSDARSPRVAARAAASPAAAILLVLLCSLTFLPGLAALPVVDRDEARFAQASRQMFESVALPEAERDPALHAGGLVVPAVGDRLRLNKPPLIYWLQTASAWAFTAGQPLRDAIWMYRVPSVICAVIAVLATWWLGVRMFDPRTGVLAAAALAVAPIVVWDSRQARADQLLLACTTVAMAALWSCWNRARRGRDPGATRIALLWVAVALGVLAKGPITPMVVALSCLALAWWTRQWRWIPAIRPLVGLCVVLGLVLPWVIAVASRVGWGEYFSIIYDEVIGRSASPKEGHWGPPGYHLVFLMVMFWPGVLLTGLGLAHAWRRAVRLPRIASGGSLRARLSGVVYRWRTRSIGRRAELFCLAWIVPSWVVFELVGTKLPHYTLPLYPAVALLSARAVLAATSGAMGSAYSPAARLGLRLWAGFGVFLLAVAAAGALWASRDGQPLSVLVGVAALAGCAGVAWALVRSIADADDGRFLRAQIVGLGAGLVFAVTLVAVAAPGLITLTPALATTLREADPDRDRPVASAGYHEDSLVFETRGRLERLPEADLDAWLRANRAGLVIVPERLAPALVAEGYRRLGGASGFNYSRGDIEQHAVLERAR